jgi:hypothetical protein
VALAIAMARRPTENYACTIPRRALRAEAWNAANKAYFITLFLGEDGCQVPAHCGEAYRRRASV